MVHYNIGKTIHLEFMPVHPINPVSFKKTSIISFNKAIFFFYNYRGGQEKPKKKNCMTIASLAGFQKML